MDSVPQTYPVDITHTFDLDGPAKVVDFGTPTDPQCPTGLGLFIPVVQHASGTLNGWPFAADLVEHALLATAPQLDALSFTLRDDYQDVGDQPAPSLDPRLVELALTSDFAEQYERDGYDCGAPGADAQYYIASIATSSYAGEWSRTYDKGDFEMVCTDDGTVVFRWGDETDATP